MGALLEIFKAARVFAKKPVEIEQFEGAVTKILEKSIPTRDEALKLTGEMREKIPLLYQFDKKNPNKLVPGIKGWFIYALQVVEGFFPKLK